MVARPKVADIADATVVTRVQYERDLTRQAAVLARVDPRLPRAVRSRDSDRPALSPMLWLGEVAPSLSQAFVVRDLITAGAFVVVYGDSNSGKTYFVLDLGLHVAAGQPWRGQRVQGGLVVYVAAEGGHGIRNRLAAYRQEATWTQGAPFAVLPQAVDLLQPSADTAPLIDAIKAAEGAAGASVGLVVLDTLARVMTGGDENSSQDMSALISNVDRIRTETGAAVLLVHHCGKQPGSGARGHSSLRAAADTEILVEGQEGTRTASVTKQRDLPSGQRHGFDLVPVQVGIDPEDRTPVTACVVAATEARPAVQHLNGKHPPALVAGLKEWARAHPDQPYIAHDDLAKLCQAQGIGRRRKTETINLVKAKGYLVDATGGYRLELND